MSEWLAVGTATSVSIGPFLDRLDGVTPEVALAGSMTVYVSKNGGAFVTRSSATAITYDRDGFYIIPLDITDVGTLGNLRLEVTDDNVHLPVWEVYRVVTASEYDSGTGSSGILYASVIEVQSFKIAGSAIDLTAYSDSEIEDELNLASRFIEHVCNDTFYEESDKTLYLDGNGITELFFYPGTTSRAIAITSVSEMDDDGSTVLRAYTENTDYKLYDHYISMFRSHNADRPRLSYGHGGLWPRGIRNIRIIGDFGRESVPAEIKRATILLALERMVPGSTQTTPKDVTQSVWSDFTISYRGSVDVGTTTGFPDVDRLLMPHVNVVDMFLAVPDKRTFSDPL